MLDQPTLYTLLRSNDPPSESFVQDVRLSLHTAENQLEKIEAQIQALRQQADATKSTISQFKAILSPIRVVSDDVLREVFTQAIQGTDDTIHSPKQRDVTPMLLAHICQRWRAVALSTPALWCRISITLPSLMDPGNSECMTVVSTNAVLQQHRLLTREADRLQQWFKRAGALPLSLSIKQSTLAVPDTWFEDSRRLDPGFSQKLSWMFEIISTYLPRCERLLFSLPDEHIYQVFVAHATPDKIERIKYFKPNMFIPYDADGWHQRRVVETPLFTSMPALRRLHLPPSMAFVLIQEHPSHKQNIWKELTHITVEGFMTLAQVAVIFEHCSCLVELQLDVAETSSWGTGSGDQTTLPGQPHQSTKGLFAPNLQSLKLKFTPDSPTPWHTDLSAQTYSLFTPRLQSLQYTVEQSYVRWLDAYNGVHPRLDFTAQLPLDHILRSAEGLASLTLSGRKTIEQEFRSTLPELGACLTHLSIGTEKNNETAYVFQEYVDNGYSLVSETDYSFQNLFPLPEWCKMPLFAAPVPLAQIHELDIDALALDRALEDLHCPQLQHLDLCGLQSVRSTSILAFIVYRLRLYEYTRSRGGSKYSHIKPLKSLTAGILGKNNHDVDVSEAVQSLAAALGLPFRLKVEYPDMSSKSRINCLNWHPGWP